MAVQKADGVLLRASDGARVGGGPCALVVKAGSGGPLVHGTCILQRIATEPTPIDLDASHRLVLPDGRSVDVRILKRTMTSCGPEIVRFEGPGSL